MADDPKAPLSEIELINDRINRLSDVRNQTDEFAAGIAVGFAKLHAAILSVLIDAKVTTLEEVVARFDGMAPIPKPELEAGCIERKCMYAVVEELEYRALRLAEGKPA
jgi:hypothetical protein